MKRGPSFRKSFRDTMAAAQAVAKFHETMYGDLRRERGVAEPVAVVVPAKRVRRVAKPRKAGSEAANMRAIRKALFADPRVASVQRNQSMVVDDGRGGRYTVGSVGKLDLTVYLHDGRYAEIECKSDAGRLSDAQARRIARIRADGGLAGMARTPAEALAILDA